MTTIPSTTPTSTKAAISIGKTALGSTDFLRLMTEQMKQQDPFAPQDNSQMIAQLAQIASSSGISDLNTAIHDLGTKLDGQTDLLRTLVDHLPVTQPSSPTKI